MAVPVELEARKARSRLSARTAAVAAIAVLVPILFVGNGLYVVLHEWFIRAQYARSNFPADDFGMKTPERTRLAVVGLESILPWHRDGVDRLREARFDDGAPAFESREVRHMSDVRRLLTILLAIHAVTLVTLVVLAAMRRTRDIARRALRAGAFVTLGLFALVGVLLVIEPDWFLTSFHTIFFSGSSWRFGDHDTLRRLFPDLFWDDTTVLLGAFAFLQAVAVIAATWWWRGRSARAAN